MNIVLPVDYQSFSPLADGLGTADARSENNDRTAIEAPANASAAKQSTQDGAANNANERKQKSRRNRDTVTISAQGKQASQDESSNTLSPQEKDKVATLKERDREVRIHEQAHAAVGGQYAGSPSYEFETGPDGKRYAVAGEVSIDVSTESEPQDTIEKMQIVRSAALAPAQPSTQDLKVAAQATQQEGQARAELSQQQLNTKPDTNPGSNNDNATRANTQLPNNPKTLAYANTEAVAIKSQFIATA